MTRQKDEMFDTDETESDNDYEQMRDMLYGRISDFAEEHGLPIGALSPLLVDLAVTTRMTDYVLSVDKPSVAGLKLDLERMQREVADFVRDCKRHADDFIATSKDLAEQARAEAEVEIEDGEEDHKA
jgi:hypothetical protein